MRPDDLGKLSALQELPNANDWQSVLVHAMTGGHDSVIPAAAAGTVTAEGSAAAHPNSHFILHV
jgi:hypothetical protein